MQSTRTKRTTRGSLPAKILTIIIINRNNMESSSSSHAPVALATSLSAINVAMVCNNVGCDLLAINDASSAIETFSLALKLMRTISQVRVDPTKQLDLPAMASQAHRQVQKLVQEVQRTKQNDVSNTQSSSSNKFSSRCIKMSYVQSPLVLASTPFLNRNSTILLYNMGLACLVHGTPPMLSKSLPLFEMAYKLGIDTASAKSHSFENDSDEREEDNICCSLCVLQRICMDSLHFSAQLYHTNSDFDMAEKILMELRKLIAQLPPTHDPQEQTRRHHFWILKDLLQKPSLAAAA